VVTCDGIGGVDKGASARILVPNDEAAGEVGLEDRLTGDGALGAAAAGVSKTGC